MPDVAERPVSVKLRPWLEKELRREFEERGLSVSEGLRRALEEWWAERHLPVIEFRDTPSGRRAAVEGGPEVWEIVSVLRDYGGDRDDLHRHFGWLEEAALDSALAYYERFPEPVDALVEENERLARYLAERLG